MKTWFTSDLHLGHRNIIDYCRRPFNNVEDMNARLIEDWNAVVGHEDAVYVVGDFTLHGKPEAIDGWLVQLNGTKHLIRGNHDNRKALKKVRGWASVNEVLDLKVDTVKIRLCHYKLEDWRGPRLLLHGHRHGVRPPSGPYSYDVGVDANGYQPVQLVDLVDV